MQQIFFFVYAIIGRSSTNRKRSGRDCFAHTTSAKDVVKMEPKFENERKNNEGVSQTRDPHGRVFRLISLLEIETSIGLYSTSLHFCKNRWSKITAPYFGEKGAMQSKIKLEWRVYGVAVPASFDSITSKRLQSDLCLFGS